MFRCILVARKENLTGFFDRFRYILVAGKENLTGFSTGLDIF